jgi:hypothetical protein
MLHDGITYQPANTTTEAELGQFRRKQGHICCGCCCDTRRAAIICNILIIILDVIGVTFIIAGIELKEFAKQYAQNAGDEDDLKDIDELPLSLLVVLVFFHIFQIVMLMLGVQGAITYKRWMVQCAVASYAVAIAVNLFLLDFGDIFIAGLCAYPNILFIREMDQNIMTPDNYPNEVHSCCCI